MRSSLLTLHRLPAGHRILYTGVLLFFVLGYGAGLLQQELRSDLSPRGVAEWYLGNADDPDADRLLFAKEPHEVLDAVWRRSIANLIPAIVMAALVVRASMGRGARGTLAASVVALALADTASPAVVRWGGAALAGPAFLVRVGLAALALAIAGIAIREMWLRRTAGPRARPISRET